MIIKQSNLGSSLCAKYIKKGIGGIAMSYKLIHISEDNLKFFDFLENMEREHKKIGRITLKGGIKMPFVYIGEMIVNNKKSHVIKIIIGE